MSDNDLKFKKLFLPIISSPAHLRDWIENFLDIKLPFGHVDPDSNSSPIEAMYEAYATYRDDKCFEKVGFIWLSSRDSGKTLCGSILNTLLLLHFKAQLVHFAATKKQSEKALQYCNGFIRKLKPYIEDCGRKVVTESKSKVQVLNEDSSISYIDVIVANLAGGNSEHVPIASFDELDTLSAQGKIGYDEAKLIPTRYKGKGPLTIKYSTRKFAFGIFEQEIQDISKTGEQLLRWNIIDITQKCPESRHKPEFTVERWIGKDLPLIQKSQEEYNILPDKDKLKFEKITAYSGCVSCPLLPVCKTRLASRPSDDVGGLYKEIEFTIRQFKITSPDMASAQLMCWKASQSGLIYPRYEEDGNTLTISAAYEQLTGDTAPINIELNDLLKEITNRKLRFVVSGDWGHNHAQAFVVSVVMPNGEWWIVDSYSIPGLEFDEILQLAIKIRDTYNPKKWYMDTAEPMFIKTFNKNRMSCADFVKDVKGGIECVRLKVQDASGRRTLKVILSEKTDIVRMGLKRHHFKLDSIGNPSDDPDDDEVWSDICDSLRYAAQNLFQAKGKNNLIVPEPPPLTQEEIHKKLQDDIKKGYSGWVGTEIKKHTEEPKKAEDVKVSKNGSIIWDID